MIDLIDNLNHFLFKGDEHFTGCGTERMNTRMGRLYYSFFQSSMRLLSPHI